MTAQYLEIATSVTSAAVSAIVSTLISHPLDKASYVAANANCSFFKLSNFHKPYQGFVQASVYKAAVGTPMYFLLIDIITKILTPHLSTNQHDKTHQTALIAFGVGAARGAVATIPLAIKSYTWIRPDPKKFWIQNMADMYKAGGVKTLVRCSPAIVARDATNAMVYEYVRLSLKEQKNTVYIFQYGFLCDTIGAMCAIVCSSLFNYVRQRQLAILPGAPPLSTKTLITQLSQEATQKHPDTYKSRGTYVFKRLQLPVSLLRFAFLTPILQATYEYVKKTMNEQLENVEGNEPVDSNTNFQKR